MHGIIDFFVLAYTHTSVTENKIYPEPKQILVSAKYSFPRVCFLQVYGRVPLRKSIEGEGERLGLHPRLQNPHTYIAWRVTTAVDLKSTELLKK